MLVFACPTAWINQPNTSQTLILSGNQQSSDIQLPTYKLIVCSGEMNEEKVSERETSWKKAEPTIASVEVVWWNKNANENMPRLNVIFFNYTFFASALTSNVMQTNTNSNLYSVSKWFLVVWYGTIGIENPLA